MEKHRAMIVGAGRIGAGYDWRDDEYTHAGAYRALKDRVELVCFVEPDRTRATAAEQKWQIPAYDNLSNALAFWKPTVVSVCVQPEQQGAIVSELIENHPHVRGIWCEKPWMGTCRQAPPYIQVNYLRRASKFHRKLAEHPEIRAGAPDNYLFWIGKDDIHTRCHAEDLARWWGMELVYCPFDGPCSYIARVRVVTGAYQEIPFSLGGIDPIACMKGMLSNLLDAVEGKAELFSPPY